MLCMTAAKEAQMELGSASRMDSVKHLASLHWSVDRSSAKAAQAGALVFLHTTSPRGLIGFTVILSGYVDFLHGGWLPLWTKKAKVKDDRSSTYEDQNFRTLLLIQFIDYKSKGSDCTRLCLAENT